MRRVLNQVANAAVKTKGSVFQSLCRRLEPVAAPNELAGAVHPTAIDHHYESLRAGMRGLFHELGLAA